ncbi:Lecithin-cholesterol acyltransferase [Spironucleus salmonicida]|uniref:Lecithin-cholesterol acyltransferase n=1 Tax=Spironucleus salmonicida TaxID=348837 RepID=V6LB16_9EUKA|nr:Lecithin-cholesterol acyltransferase [Spironucleus salmonicida]|eukprot:EST41650.1 hypothetical protein SS50377_18736 [Spironucleus salmonicida]
MTEVVNVFPTDFNENFERQAVNSSQTLKQPILLIPGVCGSKLVARNKISKQSEYAWINTSFLPFSPSSKAAEYLWGYNNENFEYVSFLNDYVDVEAIPGEKGCDRLLDIGILDVKYFENVNIGKYFGPMIQYLVTKLGYQLGVNLFAFSYDWRQSPHIGIIQDQLHSLIQEIKKLTSSKIQIIAHSMGGVITDTYIKLHPKTWYEDISKFIALGVPFDGCGGLSLEGILMGYTLKLPIPKCTAKVMQASCGSAACLHQKKTGYSSVTPCIFIKKLFEDQKNYEDEVQTKEDSGILSKLKLKFKQQKDEHLVVEFNDSLYYTGEIPDVAFIIAKKCFEEKGTDFRNAKETYLKLQKCSKRGAIIINGWLSPVINVTKTAQVLNTPDQILENDFKKGVCNIQDLNRTDFSWECYSVWSDAEMSGRRTHFQHKNIKFNSAQAKFDEQIYDFINNTNEIIVENSKFNLREYASGLQYYRLLQQTHEPVPQNINSNSQMNSCMSGTNFGQVGPWATINTPQLLEEQSIFQLLDLIHPDDMFESFLFKADKQLYNDLGNSRSLPINISDHSNFRFYSISGSKVDTPLHLVYSKPVRNYTELLNQKPEYINVEGDGTVFLTGALGDDFPDNVSQRYVLQGVKHFSLIMDERVWNWLAEWLE